MPLRNKRLIQNSNRWRCDMHVTYGKTFDMIAFNGRLRGGNRQVFISFIGNDSTKFSNWFT